MEACTIDLRKLPAFYGTFVDFGKVVGATFSGHGVHYIQKKQLYFTLDNPLIILYTSWNRIYSACRADSL